MELLTCTPSPYHCLQSDVDTYCAEAKNKLRGNATVLKCLVDNFRSVSEACQTEMSRAVRIALWDYKPGAGLTLACDSDVTNQCPKVGRGEREAGAWHWGPFNSSACASR